MRSSILAAVLASIASGVQAEITCSNWVATVKEDADHFWSTATQETIRHCLEVGYDPNAIVVGGWQREDGSGIEEQKKLHANGASVLRLSIFSNNFEASLALLNGGANARHRDFFGISDLAVAAGHGSNLSLVERFIELEADIHARDELGYSLLHYASLGGNVEVVNYLIDLGLSVSSRAADGLTPLHWASNPHVAKALLDAGADVNAQSVNAVTPIHSIVTLFPNVDTIKTLIAAGAKLNVVGGYFKMTELGSALSPKCEHSSVILTLIYSGSNVNWYGENSFNDAPLHLAIRENCNPTIVNALLDAGADARVRNRDDLTPFGLAKEVGYRVDTDVYWRLNDAQFQ